MVRFNEKKIPHKAVGLNFNVFNKYLEWLTDKEIIHVIYENEPSEYESPTLKGTLKFTKL